jgi:hypothetical protein
MFEWNAEQQSEWLLLFYAQNEFLIVRAELARSHQEPLPEQFGQRFL